MADKSLRRVAISLQTTDEATKTIQRLLLSRKLKGKTIKKQSAYFYFMKNNPDKIKHIPAHFEYWKKQNLNNYSGGPFADRSGGLITFEAANLEAAAQIIMSDPFLLRNLIENKRLKEWIAE